MGELEREREEIAQITAELALGKALAIQLFAAELAGRIRARSVPPSAVRIPVSETARLLGVCRGRLPELVADGTIPTPDEHGLFLRCEIEQIRSWIAPYLTSTQFERLAKLREAARARSGQEPD